MSGNGGDQTTAFVHTHGARLVRLARLLGADQPEQAAADAMAATSMRWSRRRDAHEHLLAAARRVAHSGTPPVREDTRLHAWLDRAELEPYEVDVTALSERTGHELLRHAAALRRRRLWWVAGAAAAVVLAAASSLWPGDDRDPMRTTAQDPSAQTAQPGGGGPSSPPKQRAVRRVESSGVVLRGRALTIMQTSVYNDVYVATMLAIGCTSKHGARAICLVSAPPSGSLSEIDDDAVVAYLPRPRHGDPVSDTLPTVLRDATTHALTNQTLLVDATSRDVEAVRVTYTDGSQVVASRYDVREWGARLFMARNKDVQPVDVVYLDSNGRTLARRSPTFAVR